jgi:polysaccharide biosynthesis/export protein
MKTENLEIICTLLLFLILTSCVTKKSLTYLQYSKEFDNSIENSMSQNSGVTPSAYKLMSSDILYIRVITPDPKWSELFNVTSVGAGGAMTEESAALSGYPIDEDGNIEIPFAGKLHAAGKTLAQVQVGVDSILNSYVKDASITVRLVNNYVNIIGEVRTPGRYPITKRHITVFDALSMAGDLTDYSNRQKIQLIRPSPDGPVIKKFSLLDRSILTSELFYIMPNDIIYVQPGQGKFIQANGSNFALIFTTINTFLLIWTLVRSY